MSDSLPSPPSTLTGDLDGTWAVRATTTLQTLSSALPLIPDGRFQANQDDRTILFSDATGAPTTRASFAIVGTYSTRTDSWLWGWANERPRAVVARLKREGSAVLPGLGTFTLDPTLRFRPEPWASA